MKIRYEQDITKGGEAAVEEIRAALPSLQISTSYFSW